MSEPTPRNGIYTSDPSMPVPGTFYVDGVAYTTADVRALQQETATLRQEFSKRGEKVIAQRREFEAFKTNVHDSIAELVANDSLGHEDANQFLDELGLDRLATEYEWTIAVTLTGTVVSTMDEEDLCDWMASNVSIEASAWTDDRVPTFGQDSYDVDDLKVTEA